MVMGRRLFDVVNAPGARTGRLVGELQLYLALMVLGGGTPLFRSGTRQMYRQRRGSRVAERRAPHLRTRVSRDIVMRHRSSWAPEIKETASSGAHG
jgi:hypothetical protein